MKYLRDINNDIACAKDDYKLKVEYFQEKNQYIFSCLSENNINEIIYVTFSFDDENNLIYNLNKKVNNDQCTIFNGYNLFYSNDNDNYYIISDYICNKTSDESQENTEINENETDYECHLEKCLTCDTTSESKNLCKKCNENKNYFPLKNSGSKYKDCYNESTKPYNYFLNNLEKYYEPCYKTCAKCEKEGDEINNNCLSCEFGYTFLPGFNKNSNSNCYVKCPYYFYFTLYGQYKCTKLSTCPEDYYLLIREKSQCIENCTKDDEYKYQYDGECYKQCIQNSEDFNNNFICLDNNIEICSLNKKEILLQNEEISKEELDNLAKIYAKEFFYTDNHISLFIYKNYEIALYKNYLCISDLALDIPSIDLGNCYKKIQKKYEINHNLIIEVISQRKQGFKYPIINSFNVFSPYNGNYLEIKDICENEGIKVQEDISMKIEDKEKYNLVKYLSQQNIDVFNLSSDFYSDICYYFESPIKKDIALKDRIKIFFPNITLCENGCSIKGINATSMKAECDCKMNNLFNDNPLTNNAFYRSQVKDIEELISQVNIEVLKCSSNLFKNKKASSFICSFIVLSLVIIQIVLTILYYLFSLTPIRIYIFLVLNKYLSFIKKKENAPPKKETLKKKVKFKNDENDENDINEDKKLYKGFNTEISKYSKKTKKKKINKINSTNPINSKRNLKKSLSKSNNINNSKDIIISLKRSDENNNAKEKIKVKQINIENKNKIKLSSNSEFNINIEEYLETELENLVFEEVLERDKRKVCSYLVEKLKYNLLIVHIFLIKEPLRPKTINISLFILNIDLYLIVNALFINEEFISNVFNSDKDNFFSFLRRCIDRIFYTTIVKVILNYIIDFFFIEEKKIKIILKSKKNTINDIKIKINEILEKIMRRFLFFIIFVFVFLFFSLFYITCFNYRYYYSIDEWIKSSIFIIIFMEILSITAILLESSFRFLSFKLNSEKIYKLSLFFS